MARLCHFHSKTQLILVNFYPPDTPMHFQLLSPPSSRSRGREGHLIGMRKLLDDNLRVCMHVYRDFLTLLEIAHVDDNLRVCMHVYRDFLDFA